MAVRRSGTQWLLRRPLRWFQMTNMNYLMNRRMFSEKSGTWNAGMGIDEKMIGALKLSGYPRPTFVQARVIPEAMTGKDIIYSAQTGTGKTLAYLIPLIERMLADEREGIQLRPRRPRSLVIVPTRELAHQVLKVAKGLCHHIRFSSAVFTGGRVRQKFSDAALQKGIDLAVTTPDRLQRLFLEETLLLTDLKYIVLDEADTLVDSENGFGPVISDTFSRLHKRSAPKEGGYDPPNLQHIFASATMKTKATEKMKSLAPKAYMLEGMNLHRIVSKLGRTFRYVRGDEDRLSILASILRQNSSKCISMIFCNTIVSAKAVRYFLQEQNIACISYHGEMQAEDRRDAWDVFKSGKIPVLVCTDMAARGLDTIFVEHVILFDFPFTAEDFIHRAGRTARAGRKGKLTALYSKKSASLARAIEALCRRGGTIDETTIRELDRRVTSRNKPKSQRKALKSGIASRKNSTQGSQRSGIKAVKTRCRTISATISDPMRTRTQSRLEVRMVNRLKKRG